MMESQTTRNISTSFSTIPALVFAAFSLTTFRGEYFWLPYALVSVVFITVSALLGLFLPTRLRGSRLNRPWMWILLQGTLAWGLALLALALINMTPLCIGQDNGDGNNNLALCAVQTVGVAIAYTPVEFTVLGLSALVGGAVLDRRAASRLEG